MKKHALYLSLLTAVLSAPAAAQTPLADAAAKRQFEPADWQTVRGKPYCEIFLVRPPTTPGVLNADVYNSTPYNDCPRDKVAALDLDALKNQYGAARAIFNPRRMWMTDSYKFAQTAEKVALGGIDMKWVALLRMPAQIDAGAKAKPYQTVNIERDTEKRYLKGKPVLELISPDGMNWIMQSTVDKPVPLATFAELADKLELPPGWSFRIRTLSRDLVMRTKGLADILQDSMLNVYEACKGDVCRDD